MEYFRTFVLSLKHHDRSQRKMEGQSKVACLFFYKKIDVLLAIQPGLDPHHILEPTYFLNQYKDN